MPRTPQTPEPGLPAERLELAAFESDDDGAIHSFWRFVIARHLVEPSDNDDAGWKKLIARFEAERGGP